MKQDMTTINSASKETRMAQSQNHFPEYGIDTYTEEDAESIVTVYKIDLVEGVVVVDAVAYFEEEEVAIDFCNTWRGRSTPTG